ncbi:MAG: hypothetical protein CL832_03560 [Crocinitomicaceae bacterium]|jgi:hypothetical protein|nr:hypothetical protein [Crocinitomicaceae bacterium]|tara:strand:- start:587 stop:1051 length:465 start_codon:yes stop_codon:yes gene_type:complete
MRYSLLNIGLFPEFFQINRKLVIFLFGFLLFGTLSFITYHPTSISDQKLNDNEIVLLDNKTYENLDHINTSITSTKTISKNVNNKFALIVGSYNQELNAQLLKEEMNRRGFKDCSIIYNKKPSKFWVALKMYNKKDDAIFDRERFLLDGWVKEM